MKQKIKEVQEYFISKILSGGFDIIKKDEYTFSLQIDKKYNFEIWMANLPTNRKPKNIHDNNFMDLEFTDKQAIKLDSILSPIYKIWATGLLIEKKRNELKELEEKIK